MAVIAFFVVHWYTSLFAQTFFHHRYAAHRMFIMSKFWERFFYVFSFVTQGSSYISPEVYGILHRLHHAHADTEKDPHSPLYSRTLMSLMWKTRKIYSDLYWGKVKVEEKYLRELPEWMSFNNFAEHWSTRIGWMIVYTLFYVLFAETWWMWLFLPAHFVMGPLHGAIINWFAHKYGYANFKVNDTSKNLMPVDIFMMGEGYHNNHHSLQNRANFGGIRWHELDPTYFFVKLFDKVGIIKIRPHATSAANPG